MPFSQRLSRILLLALPVEASLSLTMIAGVLSRLEAAGLFDADHPALAIPRRWSRVARSIPAPERALLLTGLADLGILEMVVPGVLTDTAEVLTRTLRTAARAGEALRAVAA